MTKTPRDDSRDEKMVVSLLLFRNMAIGRMFLVLCPNSCPGIRNNLRDYPGLDDSLNTTNPDPLSDFTGIVSRLGIALSRLRQ